MSATEAARHELAERHLRAAASGRSKRRAPRVRRDDEATIAVMHLRLALVVAFTALLAALPTAGARADLAPNSCGWATRIGADQLNLAFPDTAAEYWIAEVPMPTGGSIQLSGLYPHARYMSFIDYTAVAQSIDGLADVQIAPDGGSTNPFQPGADRNATRRSYTVDVVNASVPPGAGRAPNTLYSASADGSRVSPPGTVLLIYRVYEPDSGLDIAGGDGLPTITVIDATGACAELPRCPNDSLPDTGLTQALAAQGARGSSPLPNTGLGGTNPPQWVRFTNTANGVATGALDNQLTGGSVYPPVAEGTNSLPAGGFFDNVNVAYVATFYSAGYGPVLAFSARAPTAPHTLAGQQTMGTGQVRYWSMCTNNSATVVYGCVHDDEVPLDDQGDYRVVISTAANRPANATRDCGVVWLPAGPTAQTVAILRNMLPAPEFANAIQNATQGTELQTMGPYYPSGRYFTVGAFEQTGCNVSR